LDSSPTELIMGSMGDPRIAAFFDLDGTLITVNSGRLWIQREFRLGRLRKREVAMGMLYLAAYRFGIVDMKRAFEAAGGSVRGLPEATLRDWTREFYDADVRKHAAVGAADLIDRHRLQGHRLVLITTSSAWQAEIACEHFGLDDAFGTRFESEVGVLTGRVVPPLSYGPGKVELAERYAREHEIDLARSYFYTDSITDLPMLERVGEPRVVNPDPRLSRLARRRGYPVIDLQRA